MLLGIVLAVINIINIVGATIAIYYLIQWLREIRKTEKVLRKNEKGLREE